MTGGSPDWVEQARRFIAGSGLAEVLTSLGAPPAPAPAPGAAEHPAGCRSCPVCVGLAVLRGHRPDLVEALADALAAAATVLRAHVPVPPEGAPRPADPAGSPSAEPPVEETVTHPARPSAPVQWIEVA